MASPMISSAIVASPENAPLSALNAFGRPENVSRRGEALMRLITARISSVAGVLRMQMSLASPSDAKTDGSRSSVQGLNALWLRSGKSGQAGKPSDAV